MWIFLDKSGLRETEESKSFGVFAYLSDDDVIKQVDVENFGCVAKLVGYADIRGAWCRVA